VRRAGHARPAYHPVAPISVIPVGENWAVAEWRGHAIYGFVGFVLRRLADLAGYSDIERWGKAVRVWLEDSRHEDGCKTCSPTPSSTKTA